MIKCEGMTFEEKPKKIKIVGYMPAFNTEKTIKKTRDDIPKGWIDELFLVDNASTDNTVKVAKKLKIETIVHSHNRGYGGSQKTGYKTALKKKADIVVMIHSDYQYDVTKIPQLVSPIIEGEYEVMLGSRIRTRKEALAGGMPIHKYLANRALTLTQNVVYGLNLSEYHTGLRAFSAKALRQLPIEKFSSDWVFDQEIIGSAIALGFRIGEIPVPVRYYDDSSSISLSASIKYGLETLRCLMQFALLRNSFYTHPHFTPSQK